MGSCLPIFPLMDVHIFDHHIQILNFDKINRF